MNKFDENFIFENPSSIAIGNFDGMHLGHQTLLKNYSQNLKKYVLTFNFLFKEKHSDQTFLTSLEDKEYLAKLYGADELLYLNFDETLKNKIQQSIRSLHEHGMVSGDPHRGNFIIENGEVRIIDLSGKRASAQRKAKDRIDLERHYGIKNEVKDLGYYLLV